MSLLNFCSKKLVCAEKSLMLSQAAKLMKEHHIGDIVVVESNGSKKPLGILTDRDIVLNVVAEDRPLNTKIGEIMSASVAVARSNEDFDSALEKMESLGVRQVVLVDANGNACGLLSSDDVLRMVIKEMSGLGRLIDRQIYNEVVREIPTRRNVML